MGRVCLATLAVTRHTHSGPRLRESQAASAACSGIGAARSSRGESRRFGTKEETTRKERPLRPALLAFLIATIAFGFGEPAQAATKVTVGVLKFGTVSWVVDTIQKNGLDKAEGIELDVVPLASTEATAVGLQGGSVDIIA